MYNAYLFQERLPRQQLLAVLYDVFEQMKLARPQIDLIVVAPMTLRIWRIDLRTASRNARLAFSIRCQRSATCTVCGKALATASPYPPPRSRATTVTVG